MSALMLTKEEGGNTHCVPKAGKLLRIYSAGTLVSSGCQSARCVRLIGLIAGRGNERGRRTEKRVFSLDCWAAGCCCC